MSEPNDITTLTGTISGSEDLEYNSIEPAVVQILMIYKN